MRALSLLMISSSVIMLSGCVATAAPYYTETPPAQVVTTNSQTEYVVTGGVPATHTYGGGYAVQPQNYTVGGYVRNRAVAPVTPPSAYYAQ